ncbi:MAG: ribosome biogenesis GTPase Der, partial [Candidatus Cloacimonetes bacterium]|nr:ribosome biogenesis GTPase Der [Candidatus Cloacimonadota bacterium]
DNEKDQLEIYDFLQLGFGEAFPVAAVHGRNVGNFLDIVISHLKQIPVVNEEEDAIKVAIVGKPNVGKSSIVNRLTGRDDNIVTTVPGTTRDAIDTSIKHFGQKITIIDTAGLRRKKRIKYGVEYFSSMRTIESINRAQVVLLIIDATQGVSTQDQKIASYAHRNFKDIIVIINKWDLIEKDNSSVGKFIADLNRELPFLQYAPKIFVSALTGLRVRQILDKIMEVEAESRKRIPTAELNKFLSRVTGHFAPSHSSGKHSKIYYCTQVKSAPPTFVFFCNNPALITKHYRKYLENQLREQFKFQGVPLRVFFRGRDADDTDL